MNRRYQKPRALATPMPGHAIIEASAGTGKTYTLEHLIVELLLVKQVPIERLLVVTFTEKATAELIARVRRKLETLLAGDFVDAAPEVPDRECWTIGDDARRLLRAALSAFDTATISTIHGFCHRILTEHAFANRRLFEQTRIDEALAFRAAFYEVLRRDLAPDSELSRHVAAWLATSMVDRLEDGVREAARALCPLAPVYVPENVKAALAGISAHGANAPELLAELSRHLAHGAAATALDRVQVLHDIAERFRARGNVAMALHALEPMLERRQPELRELGDVVAPGRIGDLAAAVKQLLRWAVPLETAVVQLVLPAVQARLIARKQEAGEFDFQDMLSLVAASLAGPGGEALVRTLRARWTHALIDEFQDTDEVQWSIFRRIFVDRDPGTPPRNVLFAIGDPKQAIYSFRGADVQTYFAAKQAVLADGGQALSLTENFRSTAQLIRGYNEILLPARAALQGDTDAGGRRTAGGEPEGQRGGDGAGDGKVSARLGRRRKIRAKSSRTSK